MAVAVIGIIVIAGIASAGNGSHGVTTGQGVTPTPSASKAASGPAKIGSVIVLTGTSAGEEIAVTVVKVFRHAQPADQFNAPQPGYQLYAVQFRLHDVGSVAYSDSPSNGAAVVDAAGQSYQSSLDDVAGCQSFPGTENIAAGSSGLGCVVFEVPTTARITEVQFTLDSGVGPQTGQWDVRSAARSHHRSATPAPTTSRTVAPPPQTTAPAAAPTTSSGCYPLTNGGNCYEPGEYCRNSDHGASGVAGDGERIVCEYNDGWRWEPA